MIMALSAVTYLTIARDEAKGSLYVLTDRSEGGTSLQSGQLELMIHR
jgi:hypothetical protein